MTDDAPISAARRWAITFSVMLVTITQILDTSVTNVALPHIQGSLSAGVEEVAWVLTSYLAANAIVIPATGWLTGLFGRTRFFVICIVVFTVSSFLSGIAPNLEFLILARVLQGLGGGPIIPMSQAIMWEIFPLAQRGTAMAVWGIGIMMGPIFGPTVGGWLAQNWSWRWIFYVNLPIGLLGLFMVSAFLFDSPHHRRPGRVDTLGLVLMVAGFGCLQLLLDRGEREDWFDSAWITGLGIVAVCALVGFLLRELSVDEPILDLSVFQDRNFALGTVVIAVAILAFYASMLLLALYTQKELGYDAWTSGLVLAPGGVGNMLSLIISGWLVARVDQRALLALGCVLNVVALLMMSNLTLGIDYWSLAWPRFVQGVGMGFIFVPLTTLALATVRKERLANATAAYNVIRNFGGSVGVAATTTMLSRRSQYHQTTLVGHVNVWSPETAARLKELADQFAAQGVDAFTAERRALAMLYRRTLAQAQVLAYADEFWLYAMLFVMVLLLIPFMRRVHAEPVDAATRRASPAAPGTGTPSSTGSPPRAPRSRRA